MGTEPDRLLTEHEVGDILGGASVRTLRRWRQLGHGPPYIKVGRRVLYREADLQAWIDERTTHPGKERGTP